MQRTMYHLFEEEIGKFVEVFIDDLVVHSKPTEDHEEHLRIVLQKLASAGLLIALDKCCFFQSNILNEYIS